ncbi:MAG: HlyD family efflux transporter periplasmic adaptor subunit [Gammaproteobacteria bacterium]|nr:HlyD family efflux transporter periplasmic adaptor subunit [Gammaproteobacteria bacterium]
MTATPDPAGQLATLLNLAHRAREAAGVAELGFVALNETRQLLDYRQAALWLPNERGDARLALSGLPRAEINAPYSQWLERVFRKAFAGLGQPARMNAAGLPADLAEDWAQWLPAHGLLLPLTRAGNNLGCLLLARDAVWDEAEVALAEELAHAYGHALALLARRPATWRLAFSGNRATRVLIWLLAAGALVGVGMIPVPLTTLAPAEVVAKAPFLVRAPIEGVIDRFEVRPNQAVKADQALFEFDTTSLRNKKSQASGALALASEEFRQAAQLAVTSDKGRLDMGMRQGEMANRAAEVRYSQQMLERGRVRSPRDGVAIFGDPADWIGRAVRVGEKVMEIADPEQMELLIHLPLGDAIPLENGARIDLFLTVAPQVSYPALLEYASYRAEALPDGSMAYRLKARFSGARPARIGLAGTAKLFGAPVPLAYYVFRRPLAVARQWLGW